jgi:hypothetical protein
MSNGGDLPLLQDTVSQDVWSDWAAEWRDLFIVDADNHAIGVFNLTTYDLANSANYQATKRIFIAVAEGRPLWQNPVNRLDVSGDGRMSPVDDVLRMINELNQHNVTDPITGKLPLPLPPAQWPPYFDVNGDGFLSPAQDLLPVINFFNEGSGEGESGSADNSAVAASAARDSVFVILPANLGRSVLSEAENDTVQYAQAPDSVPSPLSGFSSPQPAPRSVEAADSVERTWDTNPAALLAVLESFNDRAIDALTAG